MKAEVYTSIKGRILDNALKKKKTGEEKKLDSRHAVCIQSEIAMDDTCPRLQTRNRYDILSNCLYV